MNRHGSLNRIYRLIYSKVLMTWVAVSELTKGQSKGGRGARRLALALLLAPPLVHAAPTGGHIASGTGSITQSGAITTVQQTSNTLNLTWTGFNVGANETVNFLQPSALSVAVNRIFDTQGAQIFGHLNANGQVYLIDPNGIVFGKGAQVNVGGLVASTLDLTSSSGNTLTFGSAASNNRLAGSGNKGEIDNQGTLTAARGGFISLLGHTVSNEGTVTAQLGTISLAGGSAFTLTFNGNQLVSVVVTQGQLNDLVQNGGVIQANGGQVILTAGAKDALLASAVNNNGIIEAESIGAQGGDIQLLSGMNSGTTTNNGTLDASAPNGGNGGFIETSGHGVNIGNHATVTTQATKGLNGTWLIDPADFTIASAATGTVTAGTPSGDISGATLTSALGAGNVTILSSQGSTAAGSGNINVNDVVSWSANTLTLTAANNIDVNAVMTVSGTGSIALNPATANGAATAVTGGTLNMGLTGSGFTGRIDLAPTTSISINGVPYTIINSLGVPGDAITQPVTPTLQALAAPLAPQYSVLGSNIDATVTNTWGTLGCTTTCTGFTPIGNATNKFFGNFNGLGHTISNLTINLPTTNNVGLFGYSVYPVPFPAAVIQSVGLTGGSIRGANYVGSLVGQNYGVVSNSFTTSTVSGNISVGGLIGANFSNNISNSYATGNVSGVHYVGGLVGRNYGTAANQISNSHASGNVTGGAGSDDVGGLVGNNNTPITNSYATGNVTGGTSSLDTGGLVGYNYGPISNSYATGIVSGGSSTSSYVGGLVGHNASYGVSLGAISNSYATGTVSGVSDVGGLVGLNTSTIATSYAIGKVTGSSATTSGGLVGDNTSSTTTPITSSYWDSSVNAGGLGTSSTSTTGATGLSTLQMQTASNFAGFTFTTTPGATGNNWVMVDANGTLNNAGGALGATFPMLASEYSTTINNAHQLQLMAMNLAGSYTLGSNIDASNTITSSVLKDIWSTTGGFVPVGDTTTSFTGTFDGLGHTISNLTINMSSNNAVGLFGATGAGSIIRNVGLVGGSMSGAGEVGGLVGFNYIGAIGNSYATGSVSGAGEVGGLVGWNSGTISNSYASGAVTASNNVGGLVGYNNSGTINNAYATGSVSGTTNVGGLVGVVNNGTIGNAFYNVDTVMINSVHQLTVGGIYNTQYTDWFTHGQTLNIANYSATLPAGSGGYYNVSTVQGLKDMLGFSESNAALNFRLTANIDLTGNAGFYVPYFSGKFDGGNNTISNLSVSESNNDIGMFGILSTSTSSVSNLGVVGGSVSGSGYVGGLVGLLNGGTISNSYATGSVTGGFSVGGLVGQNSGTVSNAHATSSVNGSGAADWIGGLVGYNSSHGTINNAYATGSVSSLGDTVGGLVGYNYGGTISNSYATGSVSGTGGTVGGLVGANAYGAISNAYATGSVSGSTIGGVGGLVGYNYGTISNSYAAGKVTGGSVTTSGGLVGDNRSTAVTLITNSYWDSSVNAAGLGTSSTSTAGATGLTTSQMQAQASFAGFDFTVTPIWGFVAGQNNNMPILCAFNNSCVAVSAVTMVYVDPITGSSIYGNTPGFNYTLVNSSGASLALTNASLTGTATYGAATGSILPTSTTNVGIYSYDYLSGLSLSGSGAGNYQLAPYATASSWSVTPRSLTATINAGSSVYGSTLTPGLVTLGNVVNGDSVSATAAISYTNVNLSGSRNLDVGTYDQTVGMSNLINNGLGNYSLATVTNPASYTVSKLALTGTSIAGVTTTYGTPAGSGLVSFANVVSGDVVTDTAVINNPVFSTSNHLDAGSYTQTAGTTLAGADAGNYSFGGFTSGANYVVNKLGLTVSATGTNRVYDGTLVDAVLLASTGVLGADKVNFSDTSANFSDQNVGTGKTVSVTGLSVSGTDGGNYVVNNATATTTANITPATLMYVATPVNVVEGQASLPVLGGTVVGFVGSDTLTNSTTGTATWSSPALATSAPGHYAIDGSGLALDTLNYLLEQAPGNATALNLEPAGGGGSTVATQLEGTGNSTGFDYEPVLGDTGGSGGGSNGSLYVFPELHHTHLNWGGSGGGSNGSLYISNGGVQLPSGLVIIGQ